MNVIHVLFGTQRYVFFTNRQNFGCISNCRKIQKNLYLCANQTNKKLYDMTKEEYMSLAESYYVDIEILNDSPTFYDYEKSLFELMQKLSCDLMEKQLCEGSVSRDRRKKNSNPLRRNQRVKITQIHRRDQKWLWH